MSKVFAGSKEKGELSETFKHDDGKRFMSTNG